MTIHSPTPALVVILYGLTAGSSLTIDQQQQLETWILDRLVEYVWRALHPDWFYSTPD